MAGRTKGSRSAAGTGTIRKKAVTKNGKTYTYWEGRYTVGFDPGTGKQRQRSISGKTQKEVAQKLRQITAEIDRGTYQEPEKMTLKEWLDIWVTEYLGNTKPHTRKSYISIINNHINPALGAVSLSALTPIQVQRMINGIRSTKPSMLHQKVNPKTIKNVHSVLHSALSQAVQCGLLRSNPADHAVLPRRSRAEIHVLEAERITEFLRAIEGHRYQYLYLLDLLTGMRQSELLGLQWEDIDWEKGCITVKRQLQFLGGKEGYRYTTPKSNKPRIIVLPDAAIRALEKQQALRARYWEERPLDDREHMKKAQALAEISSPYNKHVLRPYYDQYLGSLYRGGLKRFKETGQSVVEELALRHLSRADNEGKEQKTVSE